MGEEGAAVTLQVTKWTSLFPIQEKGSASKFLCSSNWIQPPPNRNIYTNMTENIKSMLARPVVSPLFGPPKPQCFVMWATLSLPFWCHYRNLCVCMCVCWGGSLACWSLYLAIQTETSLSLTKTALKPFLLCMAIKLKTGTQKVPISPSSMSPRGCLLSILISSHRTFPW